MNCWRTISASGRDCCGKRSEGAQLSWAERKRLFELYSEHIETYLDAGRGECWFNQAAFAERMANALQFFHGQRYELGAWVVMPNHVHVIVRPGEGQVLDKILQSWKGFTAREANKMLGRTGESFWAREYYDHWVRDADECARLTGYIHGNPRKAGLCGAAEEWIWSSAHPRWRAER